MFQQKASKFFLTQTAIFAFVVCINGQVLGQAKDSLDKINYYELLDLLFEPNRATDENIDKFYSIHSKFNTQELKEFNKVLLKRNLEAQLKEKQTNKWMLMSEEQIRNSVYNQGLYYEILLKYSLEEFQKPYNQIPMELDV